MNGPKRSVEPARRAVLVRRALWLVAAVSSSVPVSAGAQVRPFDLIARPGEPRSFLGAYREGEAPIETELMGMGLADAVHLLGGAAGGGTQYRLDLAAGVAAEFDMAVSSFDFLAADFVVGLPLALRRGDWSGRIRLYHQSSHLGDDLIGREDVELPLLGAFDFEALEAYVGREIGGVLPYVGGELRLRTTPDSQSARVLHAGLQTSSAGSAASRGIAFMGGAHITFSEDTDGLTVSARGGADFRRGGSGAAARVIRVQVELLQGSGIAGRFFRQRRSTVGLSLQVVR